MEDKKLLLELINKKVKFKDFYSRSNNFFSFNKLSNILYYIFSIIMCTPVSYLIIGNIINLFNIFNITKNNAPYLILLSFIIANFFILMICFKDDKRIKERYLCDKKITNKINLDNLDYQETFIILLKELDEKEIEENLNEIIEYSKNNELLKEFLKSLKSEKYNKDIENIMFKNKDLLINFLLNIENKNKVNYFFSNNFQKKFNKHINVKDRLDISRSVLIGKNENFIKWYVDNLDENANKILDFFKEINYTGDGLYLLKESMKDHIKDNHINNDILKDLNNNLVYQF